MHSMMVKCFTLFAYPQLHEKPIIFLYWSRFLCHFQDTLYILHWQKVNGNIGHIVVKCLHNSHSCNPYFLVGWENKCILQTSTQKLQMIYSNNFERWAVYLAIYNMQRCKTKCNWEKSMCINLKKWNWIECSGPEILQCNCYMEFGAVRGTVLAWVSIVVYEIHVII